MSLADEFRAEMPEVTIVALPVVNPIMAHLERCRQWLEPALETTFFTWADVEQGVVSNQALLVPGVNCAMLTEDTIYESTGTRAMHVWLAGGDMDELVQMAPGVEAMARLRGCKVVTIDGRKGWERVLKAFGYQAVTATLHKNL